MVKRPDPSTDTHVNITSNPPSGGPLSSTFNQVRPSWLSRNSTKDHLIFPPYSSCSSLKTCIELLLEGFVRVVDAQLLKER